MARNLLAEHRVSDERFQDFLHHAGDLSSIVEVNRALAEYQSQHVRPPIRDGVLPAYARPDNVSNLTRLTPEAHLGTVLDLTRLGRVYAEANSTFGLPEFTTYGVTNPRDQTAINEFLELNLGDPNRREPFIRAIFRAMNLYRRRIEDRRHPTWAAEWNCFHALIHPTVPETWLQAVGVPRDNPVWLLVLRYPIKTRSREITLFRPTQLDAGWYAHHFPSPPQAEIAKGGYAMFLDLDNGRHASPPPVSEFVHEQVDFTINDWFGGGRLVGFTGGPVDGTLDRQRALHLDLLQAVHGKEVRDWMPDCL